MKKIILSIGGMSCSACSNGLEKYLNKQEGIKNASVNLVLAQALIEYEDHLNINDLNRFIKEAGFESLGIYSNKKEEKKDKKIYLVILSILAILMMYISMGHMIGLPNIIDMHKYPIYYTLTLFILTIPFLIYGIDIFKGGYKNLIHKTPNMDTLVSIGVISSFIYSIINMISILKGKSIYVENLYFESSAIVIYFIKLGRFIDSKNKEKTKEAIQKLVQITPDKALLKVENGEKEVTIDEVKKGDILIAKPGMKISVDGVIIKGESHFDEAFITGEAIPKLKSEKDGVIAGSLNIDGYIEYEAIKIGKESTISEIVKLVVEATNTKAPIAKIADRVSNYFVPTIMIIAILTFLGYLVLGSSTSEALTSFVTVLVVSCPCALGLATPLAIVVSEGLCAKNGILIKTSETLENAHKVDTVVFDKTGTLTYGNLKISKVFNYSNYSEDELLSIVASLENKSTHPISKAFSNIENLKEVTDFKNIPGIGLEAEINNDKINVGNNKLFNLLNIENSYKQQEEELSKLGNSIIYIIKNEEVIGLIGVNDVIRNNAKVTIDELKKLGKEIIMLTGDNEKTAKIIANQLKIETVIANVMPSDKTKIIKDLMNKGKKVMMIGDGINDAPSLATANIGVSVSSGTDIANDSAAVILINDDIKKIPMLMNISKKTIKNIKQNLFWAFFYNVCMIPIAIGLLKPYIIMNPMLGSLAMTISSLTVVFNTLRLKNIKL